MMSAHNRLCKQFFLFNILNEIRRGVKKKKKNGEENYRQKFHSSLELLKAEQRQMKVAVTYMRYFTRRKFSRSLIHNKNFGWI